MTTPDQKLLYLLEKKELTLFILEKISKQILATKKGDDVIYIIEDFFNKEKKLQKLEEDSILSSLGEIGLLEIFNIEVDDENRRTYQFGVDIEKLNNLNNNLRGSLNEKKQIIYSSSKGIFLKHDPVSCYGIRGKRKLIFENIANNKNVRLSTLVKNTEQPEQTVIESIAEINKFFSDKVVKKYGEEIISHEDSSGYRINNVKYQLVLES